MQRHSIPVRILRRLLRIFALGLHEHLVWAISTLVPFELAHSAFLRNGRYLFKQHYYLPIPDAADKIFDQTRAELAGVKINTERCLAFLEENVLPYKHEYLGFPRSQAEVNEYAIAKDSLINSSTARAS